ncbi:hypothetical protein [Actinokineospora sp. NPDC004072]
MDAQRENPVADDEGGDPVCWMSRVCPECGLFAEGDPTTCERCGADLSDL